MCRCWHMARHATVLIIGAGDGGVLRRVLQHRSVKRAVMVEIDGEVIRLSKQFLPRLPACRGTIRAPNHRGRRHRLRETRAGWRRSTRSSSIHRSDRRRRGVVHRLFYANAARILTPRGLVVNQCGVPFMQADELRETSLRRANSFRMSARMSRRCRPMSADL